MAKKPADTVNLILRLPRALHRQLTQQARRNNVSLNTEIVNQLAGAEAATAKRLAAAVKPLVDEAIETAVTRAYDPPSPEEMEDFVNTGLQFERDSIERILQGMEKGHSLMHRKFWNHVPELRRRFRERWAAKDSAKEP